MAQAPFVVQPQLTAITLAYRNSGFIADAVMPRVEVASESFKYSQYTTADAFTIPDTRVGRKSAPNQIDWSATESTASTQDYALDAPIPGADLVKAQSAMAVAGAMPIDPRYRVTELLTDQIALDREQRVANLVFNAATYPAANKTTLSGTSQWSDTTSDPISAILTALDIPLIRPNVLVLGQAVWTKLRMHPKVTAAIYPAGGNATGGATPAARRALADVLEIEDVLVGASWYNSAKPGQTASMARLWGKFAAALYRAPVLAGPKETMTFGFTAQFGPRIAGTIINDPDIGMRGGERVRVGEAVKELVVASDAGYLWSAAVA